MANANEEIAESLEFRAVPDRDFQRVLELDEEYVGMGQDKLTDWKAARPDWFRGAYLKGELVGVCYGNERPPGAVVLQGIAVVFEYWRKGIGSKLIGDFERTVFSAGIIKISLGSAADKPTESFYIKNRYRATHVMLRVAPDGPKPGRAERLPEPDRVVDDGDELRLSFPIDEYETKLRDDLERAYAAREGIFIFEKIRDHHRAVSSRGHD